METTASKQKRKGTERLKSKKRIYSAPGRTEIIGNHCDHQHGCVIAAAIDRDIRAEVVPGKDTKVTLVSEGYGTVELDLKDTKVREEEKGTTAALIRGMAAYYARRGYILRGFRADVTSNVPAGAGISSSAAFETLMGVIITDLSDRGLADPVSVAVAGLYAENVFFGKPSGLMDQMASANGGLTFIDFKDPEDPVVERLQLDPAAFGYRLCLVNTGGSHADLTDAYAAIPLEMCRVAEYFGKRVLREVDPNAFWNEFAAVRTYAGDRAVLRAAHFFGENERVFRLRQAIRTHDFDTYISLVRESGQSSYDLLQNIFPDGSSSDQSLAAGLLLSGQILSGEGASRVHGGGFAGTIQAYVPQDKAQYYAERMEAVFGKGSVHFIRVCPEGGRRIV